jgi:AcrR family transcriptional regulator
MEWPVNKTREQAYIRPARGVRPSNRRALIVAAASELFYRNGFAKVGIGDVAEAVAVGPSALYRHFRNKQVLLHAVVGEALSAVLARLDELSDEQTDYLPRALATMMFEHRATNVLWHRDTRHVEPGVRAELRHQLRSIGNRLAELLRRQRPELESNQADLLGWAAIGIATSASFHSSELPNKQMVAVLADMIDSVIDAKIPQLEPAVPSHDSRQAPWSPSRRTAILGAATKLFGERGFAGVGVEDIGAAVGIAGPSIYSHFDSKENILVAILDRGSGILQADMDRVLIRATGPADALHGLLASYTEFTFENSAAIGLLLSDIDQLSPEECCRIRRMQHDYITQWVHVMRQLRPDLDPIEARIRVQAVLHTTNDIAATPHLRAFRNVGDVTRQVCTAALHLTWELR